jgi:hypothetical protein
MELFTDNHKLLKGITAEQIVLFVNLLDTYGRASSYITFMSILCCCDGEALSNNQNYICEKLVAERPDLLIPIKQIDGIVCVAVDEPNQWLSLEEFVQVSKKNILQYFIDTVILFSKLCKVWYRHDVYCRERASD